MRVFPPPPPGHLLTALKAWGLMLPGGPLIFFHFSSHFYLVVEWLLLIPFLTHNFSFSFIFYVM